MNLQEATDWVNAYGSLAWLGPWAIFTWIVAGGLWRKRDAS